MNIHQIKSITNIVSILLIFFLNCERNILIQIFFFLNLRVKKIIRFQ